MRIIFLDIDGPMIPLRAYFTDNQTKKFVTSFDPVAVSLVNRMANISGAKIVVHSSWRKPECQVWLSDTLGKQIDLKQHLIDQGIKENLFHEDWVADYTPNTSRWHDIKGWLSKYDNITHYVILDDETLSDNHLDLANNLVSIDFEEGLTLAKYRQALKVLGVKDKQLNFLGLV